MLLLTSQTVTPQATMQAPENLVCPLPRWMYPSDSPCSKQDTVFQSPDVFNMEKGVIQPAKTVGAAVVSVGKWVFFAVVLYYGLTLYALVKR